MGLHRLYAMYVKCIKVFHSYFEKNRFANSSNYALNLEI